MCMYPLENNKNVNIQLYYVYTIIHIIFNYIFCCGGVWCSGVLWGDYKVQSNNILTLKKKYCESLYNMHNNIYPGLAKKFCLYVSHFSSLGGIHLQSTEHI